jgi:hypothetical protein
MKLDAGARLNLIECDPKQSKVLVRLVRDRCTLSASTSPSSMRNTPRMQLVRWQNNEAAVESRGSRTAHSAHRTRQFDVIERLTGTGDRE